MRRKLQTTPTSATPRAVSSASCSIPAAAWKARVQARDQRHRRFLVELLDPRTRSPLHLQRQSRHDPGLDQDRALVMSQLRRTYPPAARRCTDTVAERSVRAARPQPQEGDRHHLRRQRQQSTTMVGELRSLIRETDAALRHRIDGNEAFHTNYGTGGGADSRSFRHPRRDAGPRSSRPRFSGPNPMANAGGGRRPPIGAGPTLPPRWPGPQQPGPQNPQPVRTPTMDDRVTRTRSRPDRRQRRRPRSWRCQGPRPMPPASQ